MGSGGAEIRLARAIAHIAFAKRISVPPEPLAHFKCSFVRIPVSSLYEATENFYSLGSRAHEMRTRRLHARLFVFVPTYLWHGYSDINMFVDDATLKNACAYWPFCRGRNPSKCDTLTAKMAVFGDHLPLRNTRVS
jgi:hypothetical protein